MNANGEAFATYLTNNKQLIDDYVLAHTPAPTIRRDQTLDLDRYLYGPVTRFVMAGGKRIRPALCLLGAEAVGADRTAGLPVAAAVELFQAAALIHDDIADQSTMRRGEPCVHKTHGVGIAINAGDAALVAVTTAIVRNHSLYKNVRLQLLDEVITMEEHTLEGQALDLGWARDNRWDLSAYDYLEMARCKTAYYSAAVPLAMGALSGGGNVEQVEGLRRFGLRTGLAFQIQDDLLNLVGDAEAQGKDYRSDITEGKRTLIMVWAVEHLLDQKKRTELVEILSSGTTDPEQLARAVDIAQEVGALEHAQSYAKTLINNAKTDLSKIHIAEEARRVLISMADFFIERTS
ncbi:MAG: polyprenyl synthetase family protein [Coriobacteriales bacterium]|nr:polyprenyl synthetase family protein [Coriobacteriales bacterium]